MAVATERESGLFINGELVEPVETKSVLVSTSPKPINPFGL
jgi:hypothetical protein